MTDRADDEALEARLEVANLLSAFADFEHTLRSTVFQARARADALLFRSDLSDMPPHLSREIRAIRGLCAKASRVLVTGRIFSALSRGEPLQLAARRLSAEDVLKGLIEVAQDALLLSDPAREIKCHVDREGIDPPTFALTADKDLLEQAVRNLVDNALKYSYSRSTIVLALRRTGNGRPSVVVESRGIRILPTEVRYCTQRGWRSEEAQSVTGEGSGLGLWICDQIMRAHQGDLVIAPTAADGRTVVRLVFPSASAGGAE